jgi:O-acetyl-ADP-ribose deacetylase (regulator of RNase III)
MISIHCGDITRLTVDAVVNTANPQLAGGGGVDGAIHRAAGYSQLHQACLAIGGCPTGQVRVTPGFNLPARYIFHAVGPVWRGGDFRGKKSYWLTATAIPWRWLENIGLTVSHFLR